MHKLRASGESNPPVLECDFFFPWGSGAWQVTCPVCGSHFPNMVGKDQPGYPAVVGGTTAGVFRRNMPEVPPWSYSFLS